MVYCPRCDRSYLDHYEFCPYCGEKKPDPNVCPNCLSEYNDLEFSFCPRCGEELIKKSEWDRLAEEKAKKIIEENRRSWRINQLEELGYNNELDELINQETDRIESQIDRDNEDETIKKNKHLSLKVDEIDKIKFLKELPSMENRLNAICINPGSNPCIFIRKLKKIEILEMIISDGELYLMDICNIYDILYYFYEYCIDNDIDRGRYLEEEEEYEYYVECEYSLDPITGSCILYGITDIDEMDVELSEFYPYYKSSVEREEEERRKHEEEWRIKLERKVDKNEFLKYVEDNADMYIEDLGIDGYYELTTKISNDEIPNRKTFYETEANIKNQLNEGNYKKLRELSEEERLEIKKKGLYCYVRDLHILADGSSVNKPVREKLMDLVSNGVLLTESKIDEEKERLIKIEVEKLKKNF